MSLTQTLNTLFRPFTARPDGADEKAVYDRLKQAEDGAAYEAQEDLYELKNRAHPEVDTLAQACDQFLTLRAAMQDSSGNATCAAREIGKVMRPGESRAAVTRTFLTLLRAESGYVADAVKDLKLVDRHLAPGDSRDIASHCMSLLVRAHESRYDAVADYVKQFGTEAGTPPAPSQLKAFVTSWFTS